MSSHKANQGQFKPSTQSVKKIDGGRAGWAGGKRGEEKVFSPGGARGSVWIWLMDSRLSAGLGRQVAGRNFLMLLLVAEKGSVRHCKTHYGDTTGPA
jgi:hypothetical protein